VQNNSYKCRGMCVKTKTLSASLGTNESIWNLCCVQGVFAIGDDGICFDCCRDYHTDLNYFDTLNHNLIVCRHYMTSLKKIK